MSQAEMDRVAEIMAGIGPEPASEPVQQQEQAPVQQQAQEPITQAPDTAPAQAVEVAPEQPQAPAVEPAQAPEPVEQAPVQESPQAPEPLDPSPVQEQVQAQPVDQSPVQEQAAQQQESMGFIEAAAEGIKVTVNGFADAIHSVVTEPTINHFLKQGAHELGAAMFNGNAFVMYPRAGQDLEGQPEQGVLPEQGREFSIDDILQASPTPQEPQAPEQQHERGGLEM